MVGKQTIQVDRAWSCTTTPLLDSLTVTTGKRVACNANKLVRVRPSQNPDMQWIMTRPGTGRDDAVNVITKFTINN